MSNSFIMGFLGALTLFWSVGAYNRLVRLRAEVIRAFSALDNILAVQSALIQATLALPIPPAALLKEAPDRHAWQQELALGVAGAQLAHALTMTRTRPLDPEAVAALSATQSALDEAIWPTDDGVIPDAVTGLTDRLRQLAVQAEAPAALFDTAVQTYNAAIRQFPASLLARVWGFRPAGLIGWPGPDRHNNRHQVNV